MHFLTKNNLMDESTYQVHEKLLISQRSELEIDHLKVILGLTLDTVDTA